MVNINFPDYVFWIALSLLVFAASLYAIYFLKKKDNYNIYDKPPKFPDDISIEDVDKILGTEKKKSINLKAEKRLPIRTKVIEEKAISEKDFKEDKFYYEAQPFQYFKRSKLSLRYWKDKRMARKYPDKVVLIRFQLNNGRHREFLVKSNEDGFFYRGEKYIFDLENRYYVIDSNIWAYDFHEGFSLSVKNNLILNPELKKVFEDIEKEFKIKKESRKGYQRKIPTDLIKEIIEESEITQIENAVNPKILERVSESQFVQMILQGATLGKLFKMLLILVIIMLIAVVADLVVDFISSGLIDEIGLGGK